MAKNDLLYSPWRLNYILSEKEDKCIFCEKPKAENDKEHLILYRGKHCFVIMNLFPYNNGHLMVVPYKHVSSLTDLKKLELNELFQTVKLSEKVLKENYNPEGLNVGINIGEAAGAGIADHLHVHIVPRWKGDSNFMTSISGTRVIPEKFERAYSHLKEQFDNITRGK